MNCNKCRKHQKRKSLLKSYSKIHVSFTAIILFLYILGALFFEPIFVFEDAKSKYAQAGQLSVYVLNAPNKPILQSVAGCDQDESPFVQLAWNLDLSVSIYDIYRNGELLVSEVTGIGYKDTNVAKETTYIYFIHAEGPFGEETSEEVSVLTGDCLAPLPDDPEVDIASIESIDLTFSSGVPQTTNTKPKFSGTSNIANARIDILLESNSHIVAQTTANANGYWSWQVPIDLEPGSHVLYVTATDPNDLARTASSILEFRVVAVEPNPIDSPVVNQQSEDDSLADNNDSNGHKTGKKRVTATEAQIERIKIVEQSIYFRLETEIINKNKTAYARKNLSVRIVVKKSGSGVDENIKPNFKCEILDSKNNVVTSSEEIVSIGKSKSFLKKIKLPLLLTPGVYKFRVSSNYREDLISAEDSFKVKKAPFISFLGVLEVSYVEVMTNLGWALLISIALLFVVLSLLFVEHHLCDHSRFHNKRK